MAPARLAALAERVCCICCGVRLQTCTILAWHVRNGTLNNGCFGAFELKCIRKSMISHTMHHLMQGRLHCRCAERHSGL